MIPLTLISKCLVAAALLLSFACPATSQQPEQPCLTLKKIVRSSKALPQNQSYHVVLQFAAQRCVLPIERGWIIDGVSWQVDHDTELQIQKFRAIGSPLADDDRHAGELTADITVFAPDHAPLGEHTVHGTLEYEALSSSGTRREKIFVTFPVEVVGEDAQANAHKPADDVPPGPLKWYQVLIVVLLFPIAFLIYAWNEC